MLYTNNTSIQRDVLCIHNETQLADLLDKKKQRNNYSSDYLHFGNIYRAIPFYHILWTH